MQQSNTHQNRLASETSPYLLQHASNPVDWYPWGEAAFALARSTGKPILLSIGYSACHWCHVMAHESFEDAATAEVMNELFINIKVDREERPDIDKIYQLAFQMLTQRNGGWPLTMFLTAEQHPFFGGTYFPKISSHDLPAFTDLLNRVALIYKQRRGEINKQNDSLIQLFSDLQSPPITRDAVFTDELCVRSRDTFAQQVDRDFGGFGNAQKFPHPTTWEFLLRHWRASAHLEQPDLQAMFMATLTLTRMAEGGVYDQLGGGFFRYSVDPHWMIPHFEKMLYDNGALLGLYSHAALATGDPLFKRVANETADWMLRDMQSPEGGYWSTLDADSEGHEGKFYVWTPEELRSLLPAAEYSAVISRFGLDAEANFEGEWHLHVRRSIEDAAALLTITSVQLEERLASARQRMLTVRNTRVWPARDEKIIVAWNALAIKGMALAARALNRDDLLSSAHKAIDFIRTHMIKDGRLLSVYTNGRARIGGYLDDHAFLLDALIECLQTRWRNEDLQLAQQVADTLLEQFEDQEKGSFFFTANDAEQLIHRPKSFSDDALPSGNGVVAQALTRLGHLLGEPRYIHAAERTLRAAWHNLEDQPVAYPSMMMALQDVIDAPQLVIIRGKPREINEWQQQFNKLYAPQRIVLSIPSDTPSLPTALATKKALTSTTAYVCKGSTCSEPLQSLAAVIALARG
jgi:uncharacterized protein